LKQYYWVESHGRSNGSFYAEMRMVSEWLRDAKRLLDIPVNLILPDQAVRKEYNLQK
jgi:hypothetical protein